MNIPAMATAPEPLDLTKLLAQAVPRSVSAALVEIGRRSGSNSS